MGVFLFIQSKNDATMAAGPTITVLDISLGAGTGPYNSTAVASDTFSRVSYYDSGYTALGFVQCTNITCSTSTITTVDNTADVGQYTSLVLGSDGFARISYYDATNDDLKFVRCADAACTDIPARVITTIDSTGDVGQYTSLSLDPDTDFARISYYDVTNSALKFVQCTDITCSTSTITTVDNTGDVGQYTSIDLDFDDFARISYYDVTNGNLKFVQCKSDDCVGVENADPLLDTRPAVQTLDSTGDVGQYTSMKIATDGFARISYYDVTNGDLKFVQCTDADCSEKNPPVTVNSTGNVGLYTSLAIGPDGFASISYYAPNNSLKLAKCTNDDCSHSIVNTILSAPEYLGAFSSLALALDGSARISYHHIWNSGSSKELRFITCTNTACTGNSTTTVDGGDGANGEYISMKLASDGFARISYYDTTNADLKFVQCTNAGCTTWNDVTVDSTGDVGQYTSLALGSDDFARISYYDVTNGNLKFVQCKSDDCVGVENADPLLDTRPAVQTLDSTGDVGQYTSMKIATDGFARISYYDVTNGDLKFVQCTNADCSATEDPATVDSTNDSGKYTSLAIGTDGLARISYTQYPGGGAYYGIYPSYLQLARCILDDCSESVSGTIDSSGRTGLHTSLALSPSDNTPHITYYEYTDPYISDSRLKFMKCADADCTSNTKNYIDTGRAGPYSSVVLGTDGFARISYYGRPNDWDDLRYIQCTIADCSTKNTTLVESAGKTGAYTSIALGSDGLSRIAYYDITNTNLKFVQCTNTACTTSNSVPTTPTILYSNTSANTAQEGSANPENLSSSSVVFSAIYNDYDSGDTANMYQLQISTDNTFASTDYDSGSSGTSMTNTLDGSRSPDITPGAFIPNDATYYYWRIKFWDDESGQGIFSPSGSNAASFSVNASAPSAPTIGTATTGTAQASVTFTAPASNGGSTITGYTVTSSPGGFTGEGATSPIIVTGLANATSYTFTVTATNAAGTGSASSASNSITTSTVPDAPTSVSAVAGNTQATVTFSAPGDNGGSAITGYTVTSSPGSLTGTGSESPITVTGLTNGTSYTFTVTATNAVGTSLASDASNSDTPGVFGGSLATGGTITYTDSDGLNPRESPEYGGGYTVHTFTGDGTFTPSTEMNVAVLVVAGGGGGGWDVGGGGGAGGLLYDASFAVTAQSYSITVGAGGAGAPDTGHGGGYNGSDSVFSTMTAVGGGGGGGFSSTNATSGGSGGGGYGNLGGGTTPAGSGTVDQGTDGGLGVLGGYGGWHGRGGGGGGAGAVGANGSDTANGGAGLAYSISGSEVYYAGGGGGTDDGAVNPGQGGLGGGGDGDQNATANTGGGGGGGKAVGGNGGSGIVIIRYNGKVVPYALVSAPSTTPGNTQIGLSWTAPSSGGSIITDYVIEYSLADADDWTTFGDGTSATTSATVTGLINGVSYDFRVSATNAIGTGAVSDTATSTPATLPDSPTNVVATPGTQQASVAFSAPVDNGGSAITGYTVTSSPGGFTGTGASSPIIVSGLSNATSYTFTVTATNAIGTSSASSASDAVTTNSAPTASSVAISGTARVGQTLTGSYSYADADSDSEGTSTFRWLRDDVAIDGATSSTYTLVQADGGTTTTFEVTPAASAGVTTGSATTSDGLAIPDNSAPSAPTTLYSNTDTATAQAGSANPLTLNSSTVVFSALYIDDDVGDIANKYQLQIATDNAFSSLISDSGSSGTAITNITAGDRSTDISTAAELSVGTIYYWRVKFWDDDNTEGSWSASGASAAKFQINAPPTVPTTLYSNTTSATAQAGSVNPTSLATTDVVFSAVHHDPEEDAGYKYQLQIDVTNDFSSGTLTYDSGSSGTEILDPIWSAPIADGSRTGDITTDAVLSAGTTYYWRIRFWDTNDNIGSFTASGGSAASFLINNAPTAPTTLYSNTASTTAQAGSTNPTTLDSADIVFSAIANDPDSGAMDKYELQISTDNTFTPEVSEVSLTYDSGALGTSITTIADGARSTDITTSAIIAENTTYYWRVKFWDALGAQGAWSVSGESAPSFKTASNLAPPITILDNSGNVGSSASFTIASADGFGRLAYYDSASQVIKVIQCTNASCSTSVTSTLTDSTGDTAQYVTIVIGADGYPRIAYYDSVSGTLKYCQCHDIVCTTYDIITIDLGGGYDVGQYPSMVVDSSGAIHISYYDSSNGNLIYATCSTTCTSTGNWTKTSVDFTGDVGQYSSIALDDNNNVYISYYKSTDETHGSLKYATNQSGGWVKTTMTETADNVGQYSSIAIGSGVSPTVSIIYYDASTVGSDAITPGVLKYVICTEPQCSLQTISRIQYTGGAGKYGSLRLTSSGLPTITYYDETNDAIKYAQCTSSSCTNYNISTIGTPGGGSTGQGTMVAVGSNNLASVMSVSSGTLILSQCTNSTCSTTPANATASAPTTLYANNATDTAQNGSNNPTTLWNDVLAFSAIYADSDVSDTTTQYQLQIDTTNDFSSDTLDYDSGSSGTTITSITAGNRSIDITAGNFTPDTDTTYYWRIRFWDKGGVGAWSPSGASANSFMKISPSISFDIDTATTDTESVAPYTVILGTLTPSTLTTSNSSIKSIFLDLDTNAANGATITVLGENGGLYSATAGNTITLTSSEETIIAGQEKFGLCVASATQDSGTGTFTASSTYDANGASNCTTTNTGTPRVGKLNTTATSILSTNGTITTGRAQILLKTAITPTTPAGSDYTETLTFIATGSF